MTLQLTASQQASCKDRSVFYLAHLWRITRQDGILVRLTDHPQSLVFSDGLTYQPLDGLSPSARRRSSELAAQDRDVKGFSTTLISEEDMVAGRYRDAKLEEFLIDWRFPWKGALDAVVYYVQEVRWDDDVWEASLADVPSFLDRPVGGVWGPDCRVEVFSQGPGQCNANPDTFRIIQNDVATSPPPTSTTFNFNRGTGAALDATLNFYSDGTVFWVSGLNKGLTRDIRTYIRVNSSLGTIGLTLPAPRTIVAGDLFDLLPGCNKQPGVSDAAGHCKNRYNNLINNQAEVYIPGDDRMRQGAKNLPT